VNQALALPPTPAHIPDIPAPDRPVTHDLRERLQAALAGRYTPERELGRGGMATVYLVHDVRHDRAVALKVLHLELTAGLGPERFLREIRTTARLDHPHILPLLDSGETEGLRKHEPV
jgi:serine/threonine protein kinase